MEFLSVFLKVGYVEKYGRSGVIYFSIIQGVRAKSTHWGFLEFTTSTECSESCNTVMER